MASIGTESTRTKLGVNGTFRRVKDITGDGHTCSVDSHRLGDIVLIPKASGMARRLLGTGSCRTDGSYLSPVLR